jgi:hypothetical protein
MNKKTTPLTALIAVALALPSAVFSSVFFDDFSTDTSANYTFTSTFGTPTATWNISSGTLNLPVTGGGNETANVFHNTALFEIGDTLSVDISGPSDTYLTVSTTTRGPNTSGQDGVRLKWDTFGTFIARKYNDSGSASDTRFDSNFSVAPGGSITLYLTRESDNTFSAACRSSIGGALMQLNTTGGTEKENLHRR